MKISTHNGRHSGAKEEKMLKLCDKNSEVAIRKMLEQAITNIL